MSARSLNSNFENSNYYSQVRNMLRFDKSKLKVMLKEVQNVR